jgi:DNA recombination protein RmuC
VRVSADNASRVKERDSLLSQLEMQKAWVLKQTGYFQKTMTVEAARIMEERGKAFTETNKKEVDAIVAPFKEKLEEFRKRVDEIHTAETATHGALNERILSLTSLNRSVSEQAERLVRALTVNTKSSGTWGETILAKILEDSGLRKDYDYRQRRRQPTGPAEVLLKVIEAAPDDVMRALR